MPCRMAGPRWHSPEFLAQRRELIAGVVREAFQHLSMSEYLPVYPVVQASRGNGTDR